MKRFLMTTVANACIATIMAQGIGQVEFSSSDEKLNTTFEWGKKMALSYAHDGNDTVGYWYEAALPYREAFCMRDVAHQSIGGEILGLSLHNKNMMIKFAQNISDDRDWCSSWEINRYDKPAPADYVDDEQFWYNLNGSPDIIYACLRLYQWTGDESYLNNSDLVNFYEKTLNDFVTRWQLEPEQLLYRARNMNTKLPFDPSRKFNRARGIPSYDEAVRGFSMAADLISVLYAGYDAYAQMLQIKGEQEKAQIYSDKALRYKTTLNTEWWNADKGNYHFYWDSNRGAFWDIFCQSESYIIWFGTASSPTRVKSVIGRMISNPWIVEQMSHFPVIMYRYAEPQLGYDFLTQIKDVKRNEYPEVSYGAVEGIVTGVMGINPISSKEMIQTLPQLTVDTKWAELRNLVLAGTSATVRHDGNNRTTFTNTGKKSVIWRAAFYGNIPTIKIGKKNTETTITQDEMGNAISYVDIPVKAGAKSIVSYDVMR